MTKYAVNSGGVRSSSGKGAEFFNEIIKDLGKNPKVLFVFFAQARERWEAKLEEYTKGFKAAIVRRRRFCSF